MVALATACNAALTSNCTGSKIQIDHQGAPIWPAAFGKGSPPSFYGSAMNHLEVGIWGLLVGLKANFKTCNFCLNNHAYNCLIHLSS